MSLPAALQVFHGRVHDSLSRLMAHCRGLTEEELNQELEGFGYPTVRLQLHHLIGAQKYWIGVLQGRIDAEEDDHLYPTVRHLEAYRSVVFEATEAWLQGVTEKELQTTRPMLTWSGKKQDLTPVHVFYRTQTHVFHHQGQVLAMCRSMGRPGTAGMDYPVG